MKKNLLLFFCSAVCSAFFSHASFSIVNPIDKIISELIYEKGTESALDKFDKTKKPFSSSINLSYINGFINSANRINQLSLIGSYNFLNSWSVSVSQSMNHHYFLNPNSRDKGLWIQDTLLILQKQFNKPSLKSNFTAGVSSTLPLSYYSQVNDIYTVSTAYLIWSLTLDSFLSPYKPTWIKNIILSIKPIVRYYFTEYTTTPTIGQSLGGVPLPQFLGGIQNISLSSDITNRFSFIGTFGRWWISTYKFDFNKTEYNDSYNNKNYKKYLRHYYLLSMAGRFKINKQWNISFSYSHVDRIDKQGRTEVVLLDDRLSTWALSTTYSFSFNLPNKSSLTKSAK